MLSERRLPEFGLNVLVQQDDSRTQFNGAKLTTYEHCLFTPGGGCLGSVEAVGISLFLSLSILTMTFYVSREILNELGDERTGNTYTIVFQRRLRHEASLHTVSRAYARPSWFRVVLHDRRRPLQRADLRAVA
jgi:hypothetical protein